MKFMFSTVYRVTQKDFYARPYTSVWAPVVARQQVKWNEAKWSAILGGGVFMEKVYRSSKWWEVKDWGESVSELVIGGGTRNCTQYCPTWVFLPYVHLVKF